MSIKISVNMVASGDTRRVVDFLTAGAFPDRASTLAGVMVKHYEIIRMLGRGGMGVVFLARDTKLSRLVALKFLRYRAPYSERLLDEARAIAKCNHENIVIIHEVDDISGFPFMVIEYIGGCTLRDVCLSASNGGALIPHPRRPIEAVTLMVSVVRALAHAHEQGIVHCDLKPENILLSSSGAVKVVDFGLAWPFLASDLPPLAGGPGSAHWASEPRRRDGAPVGTLHYMSPEQLRAEVPEPRADLWAVGIILHELVTGRHPLDPFAPGWLRVVMDPHAPMPNAAEHAAPRGIGGVIGRCLRKNRADRIATASELLASLSEIAVEPGARL